MVRHFLTLSDLQPAQILSLIDRAIELKQMWRSDRECPQVLCNRTIALVFEKTSTRTRVSFEIAAYHLGGNALFMAPSDSQLKRGESDADTARVLSGMVDLIVTRTISHSTAETYARNSSVPVVNGLSDSYHPCQLLADLQTLQEVKGSIRDTVVAWIGDGNNMCVSWANAASLLGFSLRISTPSQYAPNPTLMQDFNTNRIEMVSDPYEAALDADVVVTDTWTSMGQEEDKQAKLKGFQSYQVTESIMKQAAGDAIFMHCLPAYRGVEVEAGVIDGPQSVVWHEAENRLHAQKALLEMLLN